MYTKLRQKSIRTHAHCTFSSENVTVVTRTMVHRRPMRVGQRETAHGNRNFDEKSERRAPVGVSGNDLPVETTAEKEQRMKCKTPRGPRSPTFPIEGPHETKNRDHLMRRNLITLVNLPAVNR